MTDFSLDQRLLWVGSEPSRPTEAVSDVKLLSSREACGRCTPYS